MPRKKGKTRNSTNSTGANLGFEAKLWPSLTTCPQTGKDDYSFEKKRGKKHEMPYLRWGHV